MGDRMANAAAVMQVDNDHRLPECEVEPHVCQACDEETVLSELMVMIAEGLIRVTRSRTGQVQMSYTDRAVDALIPLSLSVVMGGLGG